MNRHRVIVALLGVAVIAIALTVYNRIQISHQSDVCLKAGGAWTQGICDMSAPAEIPSKTSDNSTL